MHYLLDGYNLAHWLAAGADLHPDKLRELLLARLAGARPKDAESITIYWDDHRGQDFMPRNEYASWCTMRFVPNADEAILDAVFKAETAGKLVVVSNDREVTGKGRQLGAKTRAAGDLLPRR